MQTILNQSATTQISAAGSGSPGKETIYLGQRTLAAVKIYQAANGIAPANQVGPKTTDLLNKYLGVKLTTSAVSATSQPANSIPVSPSVIAPK